LVQKAPAHRDAAHCVASRWVGVEQVGVGSIKPHDAQIAEWGGVEVAAERILQRARGDGDSASDVEQ